MYCPRFFRLVSVVILSVTLVACGSSGSNDEPDPPSTDTTPPAVPSGLTASSMDGEVEVAWEAVDASDLDGYNIYRSASSFDSISGLDPLNGSSPATGTSFTDGGVSNGMTYYYRVTAVDRSGNESNRSDEVEVTPFSAPPDRP